jgi:hypothetical protein
MSNLSTFERKKLPNGKPNPKYVDLCDEDPPIAGQKFACLSFVSPEKILKKRETFLFDQFIQQWDFTKSLSKFFDFLHFMAYKYNLKIDDLVSDFNDFAKEEEIKIKSVSVEDDFKTFLDKQEDALTQQFQKAHAFQTSTRGLKVRGVYPTQEEAENRCKKLRENDPNHDIFVGPVGIWVPWDPDAYKTGKIEFMEEELNQLHKEKMLNEAKAKQEFDQRVKDAKKKAIEDNIKLAEKSGNVLTQTMDEEGNLIGVKDTINFDEREVADSDTAKKNKELMEEAISRAADAAVVGSLDEKEKED